MPGGHHLAGQLQAWKFLSQTSLAWNKRCSRSSHPCGESSLESAGGTRNGWPGRSLCTACRSVTQSHTSDTHPRDPPNPEVRCRTGSSGRHFGSPPSGLPSVRKCFPFLQARRKTAAAFRPVDPDNRAAGIFYLTHYLQVRPIFTLAPASSNPKSLHAIY